MRFSLPLAITFLCFQLLGCSHASVDDSQVALSFCKYYFGNGPKRGFGVDFEEVKRNYQELDTTFRRYSARQLDAAFSAMQRFNQSEVFFLTWEAWDSGSCQQTSHSSGESCFVCTPRDSMGPTLAVCVEDGRVVHVNGDGLLPALDSLMRE